MMTKSLEVIRELLAKHLVLQAEIKVRKKSGKPFKSRLQINTVKGEKINPYTGKPGYTFEEDDSIVNQEVCIVIE